MISFYTTAFNLDDFDIDIEEALLNSFLLKMGLPFQFLLTRFHF